MQQYVDQLVSKLKDVTNAKKRSVNIVEWYNWCARKIQIYESTYY